MIGEADDKRNESAVRAAHLIAPAFAGFATWIEEKVAQHELDALAYLSREGPFLRAVVEAGSTMALPSMELAVSRRATFAPALPAADIASLTPMWDRFPTQTPEELLAALDVPLVVAESILNRHGLRLSQPVVDPWADQRITSLLSDPEFGALFDDEREPKRALLLEYLDQLGFGRHGRIGVVDLGWRGSMQSSLERLFPNAEMTGLYFGYRPSGSTPSPAGARKFGFVAGERDSRRFGQELRIAAPVLEMLTMTPGGTVVGYESSMDEEKAQALRVTAVRSPIEHEERIIEGEVADFQHEVVQLVRSSREEGRRVSVAESQNAVRSVVFAPDARLVTIYESFGLDSSVGGHTHRREIRRRDGLTSSGRRRLREAVQSHGWPHALGPRLFGQIPWTVGTRAAALVPPLRRWVP